MWGHVGLILGHVGPGLGYLEAMSGNFRAKDFALKIIYNFCAKKKLEMADIELLWVHVGCIHVLKLRWANNNCRTPLEAIPQLS